MSPPLRVCEAGEGALLPWKTIRGRDTSRGYSWFYHTVWIWPWDSGQLHHESQSFVHGTFVREDRGHVGSQQDQVRTFPVSVRVLASHPSFEQFGQIVFRPELIIQSGVPIHTAFFRSASVPGH